MYSISVYSGATVRQPFTIGGSGSSFIYGFCDHHYREGMAKEECEAFCKQAVALAMNRDGSSGGIIRMCTITKEGVNRVYVSHNELPSAGKPM